MRPIAPKLTRRRFSCVDLIRHFISHYYLIIIFTWHYSLHFNFMYNAWIYLRNVRYGSRGSLVTFKIFHCVSYCLKNLSVLLFLSLFLNVVLRENIVCHNMVAWVSKIVSFATLLNQGKIIHISKFIVFYFLARFQVSTVLTACRKVVVPHSLHGYRLVSVFPAHHYYALSLSRFSFIRETVEGTHSLF